MSEHNHYAEISKQLKQHQKSEVAEAKKQYDAAVDFLEILALRPLEKNQLVEKLEEMQNPYAYIGVISLQPWLQESYLKIAHSLNPHALEYFNQFAENTFIESNIVADDRLFDDSFLNQLNKSPVLERLKTPLAFEKVYYFVWFSMDASKFRPVGNEYDKLFESIIEAKNYVAQQLWVRVGIEHATIYKVDLNADEVIPPTATHKHFGASINFTEKLTEVNKYGKDYKLQEYWYPYMKRSKNPENGKRKDIEKEIQLFSTKQAALENLAKQYQSLNYKAPFPFLAKIKLPNIQVDGKDDFLIANSEGILVVEEKIIAPKLLKIQQNDTAQNANPLVKN